ncbi:hypothetical protein [Flagellimonas meishanensis]|uniref:hypothetical protein n=1 Tax=Flagellimonas meishanensis TaxID=2873264 RepID=UPI001CA66925|nr:hypothetical protein [[Muricauda] meishanensis]
MTKEELFNKKSVNIDLFHPEGVEFISSILQNLGYTYTNEFTEEAREHGLNTIEKLLELELIEVYHWGDYNEKLNGKLIPNIRIMRYLAELWQKGAKTPDFYGMPMFKYQKWYLDALKKVGFEYRGIDWKSFVKEKLGDLELWIEQNRPKE